MDPAFLKTIFIAITSSVPSISQNSKKSESGFSGNMSSAPFSPFSNFWMAVITEPRIVRSCTNIGTHTVTPLSVPHSEKYLQAYVLDEGLIYRVEYLLKKMDCKSITLQVKLEKDDNGIFSNNRTFPKNEIFSKKEKNSVQESNSKKSIEISRDKNNLKSSEKDENEAISGVFEDFKWFRNLQSWSCV